MEHAQLNVLWADASLMEVHVGYDELELRLRESTGRTVKVTAVGHIGFELVGFWDETVIESAVLTSSNPFQDRCLASIGERLGDPPPATGSPDRDARSFATLAVTLSDGSVLLCSAARFLSATT